jgi:hypothetical protein
MLVPFIAAVFVSNWIPSRVSHILYRLHLEVAQWKEEHVDDSNLDSM